MGATAGPLNKKIKRNYKNPLNFSKNMPDFIFNEEMMPCPRQANLPEFI